MRAVSGDLWALARDARCITTNCTVTRNHRGVMGRGVAKQAKDRYLGAEQQLARYLRRAGNHTGVLFEGSDQGGPPLIALPVKHEWHQKADINLIKRSLDELVVLTTERGWQTVLLPRPGCGNGKLGWHLVEKLCTPRLDDRFVVVYRGTGEGWEA